MGRPQPGDASDPGDGAGGFDVGAKRAQATGVHGGLDAAWAAGEDDADRDQRVVDFNRRVRTELALAS
ncbi:hypothetical protein GCM10010405_54550 [Streptomyces macrosporus]|uniref:Uncharacterized protein n=1 Tax=Streptomyces macrosporus TaxID=44032 RepID=A0ABN3KK83_9ACTN